MKSTDLFWIWERIIFSLPIKKTVRCFRALFRIWENWQKRFIPTFSLPEIFDQYDIAWDKISLIKMSTNGNDVGTALSLGRLPA